MGECVMKKQWFLSILAVSLFAGCSDDSGVSGGSHGGGEPNPPIVGPKCGDGVIDEGEVCDGAALNGRNCTVAGAGYTGTLKCLADCSGYDDSDCTAPQTTNCGNRQIDSGEACDDGNTKDGDGCSADCSTVEDNFICNRVGRPCVPAGCGNSVQDENEECDDGPESNVEYTQQNLSLCNPECKWAHYCGDNKLDEVDIANGEECDNGGVETSSERNGCTLECKRVNYCGDGIVDAAAGESCDDGNDASGDGCSSECSNEAGFTCIIEQGKSVCSPIACGNGVLETSKGEACDDGNRVSSDGCSANCQLERGFRCSQDNEGKSVCERTCGDGVIDSASGETCDDGNQISGDGCSSACSTEAGYICPDAGRPCFARACGDGILAGNEECDDGNTLSNDGCSKQCKREEGYACREANQPCVKTTCGDGLVEGDETCDEGPNNANHTAGCVDCRIQMGWQCLTPGAACTNNATCGNGKLEGAEECDEGSDAANHTAGCVDCIITTGWRCPEVGGKCIQGRHGDGKIDKGEECDDGNEQAGDGCSPIGEIEPIFDCNEFGCKPTCGDGLVIDETEECDDGNLVNGDGCSSDCRIETGFVCEVKTSGTPDVLELPIVYHDFPRYRTASGGTVKQKGPDASGNYPDGYISQEIYDSLPSHCKPEGPGNSYRHTSDHSMIGYTADNILKVGRPSPDFLSYCPGMNCSRAVLPKLGKDGTPDLASYDSIKAGSYISNGGETQCAYLYTCPEVFKWWYNDVPGVNRRVEKTMRFDKIAGTTNDYQYSSSNFLPMSASEGYGSAESNGSQNGEFTSHFQTYFKYKGGEQLEFNGDDDVWVFFNGYLGVDVGGIHGTETRTITLKNELAPGDHQMYEEEPGAAARYKYYRDYAVNAAEQLHMYPNGIYAIDMFHAERCLGGSSYKMTLRGFVSMGQSTCDAICGDGLIRGMEECDPVVFANPAAPTAAELEQAKKAGCVSCRLKSYCGNGIIEKGEGCDTTEDWCENCKIPTCGNGVVDPHEECDGTAGVSAGQVCLDTCLRSGCGDGVVDEKSGEECDDRNTVEDDNCTNACKRPICGDKIVQSWLGEVCDDGKNDGSYGGCGLGCAFVPPKCGDGIIEATREECDDGLNTGAYGTCNPDCTLPAHCGDGDIQPEFEDCDDGDQNGQPGKCARDCKKDVN